MSLRLVLFLLAASPAGAGQIGAQALDALPHADVVVLGEVHDNPVHHRNQTRAVATIGPAAVVWEMMTSSQASALPDDRSDAATVASAIGWAGSGWPDFALYHPIMLVAPAARHYGAGVPRAQAQRVFDTPLAQVFGPDAARFGRELPLAPDEQDAREHQQAQAHCNALPARMLPGMVAAQRLRDGELARATLRALSETGGPVAVITGTGHARTDTGLPALMRRAAPEVSVLSLGQLESDPGPDAPFDLWIVTDPEPREDPCDAFR